MPTFERVILESVIVGIMLIPFAYIAGYLAKMVVDKPALPEVCSRWNENYIMEWNLFFTGVIFHITCELFGINRWYVSQYRM